MLKRHMCGSVSKAAVVFKGFPGSKNRVFCSLEALGFDCKPSFTTVENISGRKKTSPSLLELKGEVNSSRGFIGACFLRQEFRKSRLPLPPPFFFLQKRKAGLASASSETVPFPVLE